MKEANTEISVVVPVYNRAHLLERSLDSIASQDYRPIELTIVDNNSTDSSKQTAERWAAKNRGEGLSIRVIEEKRPGAARARQTGLEHSRSEWIFFVDSDDEMAPGILSAAMSVKENADLIYWKRVYGKGDCPASKLDDEQLNKLTVLSNYTERSLLRRQVFNCILNTMSFMTRTEYMRRVGGWRSESRVWDDWELGIRLLTGGGRIKGLNRVGALIYPQAESITGLDFGFKQGEWEKILDYVYDYAETLAPQQRRWLQGAIDYRRINLAALYVKEGNKEFGEQLLAQTLRESREPTWRKLLLRILFNYTKSGGRVAYKLWR